MSESKRASILALIAANELPEKIIVAALKASDDVDYQRRLRMWVADCAARALPLLAERGMDDRHAVAAITIARQYAKGYLSAEALAPFDCSPGSKLDRDARRSGYSVVSEVRLAAAGAAQPDISKSACPQSRTPETRSETLRHHSIQRKSRAGRSSVWPFGWQIPRRQNGRSMARQHWPTSSR